MKWVDTYQVGSIHLPSYPHRCSLEFQPRWPGNRHEDEKSCCKHRSVCLGSHQSLQNSAMKIVMDKPKSIWLTWAIVMMRWVFCFLIAQSEDISVFLFFEMDDWNMFVEETDWYTTVYVQNFCSTTPLRWKFHRDRHPDRRYRAPPTRSPHYTNHTMPLKAASYSHTPGALNQCSLPIRREGPISSVVQALSKPSIQTVH